MRFLENLKNLKAYKTETTPCKIKLSSNESPFDLSEQLKEKIANKIKEIPFQRYPDPTAKQLKEILADFIKEEEGISLKPENFVLGNGSDEIINLLITIIDKNVAYPIPTFPMYQVSSDVARKNKIEFELDENFDLVKEQIDKALEKNPDIFFFASPNNPTGNSFNKDLINYVIDKGIFTVIDEAYIHFSDKESFLKKAIEKENVAVLRTLSKIGLASIRVGYLIAKEEIATQIDKARLPFNITYPSQEIAKIVLTEGREEIKNQIKIVKSEREKVIKEVEKIKDIKVYPSDANFFLIRVKDADYLHKELIKKGILTRNMSHLPKMEGCIRVSIGKPEENEAFITALKEIFD